MSYGIKACNTLDIGIICMHCLIFSPPGENPIMKPPLWRSGIWWKLQVCNLLHYTDSRSFTGSMRNMSVSLYAHTERFLLQGKAFLFHKQNRNLAPSFPQTHTLTKPFPQILITFSSPEILSLKQSLFIFTCNSVSLSEQPEITLLLSVEHLSWVCSQHWHNNSVIPKHNDWLSRPRFPPALCYHPNICHFVPWVQHLGQVNTH